MTKVPPSGDTPIAHLEAVRAALDSVLTAETDPELKRALGEELTELFPAQQLLRTVTELLALRKSAIPENLFAIDYPQALCDLGESVCKQVRQAMQCARELPGRPTFHVEEALRTVRLHALRLIESSQDALKAASSRAAA